MAACSSWAAPTLVRRKIWDPVTGTFSPAGVLGEPRGGQTATLLGDGRVLIVGGIGIVTEAVASASVFYPDALGVSAASPRR